MPDKIRNTFVDGIKMGAEWVRYGTELRTPFLYILVTKKREQFKLTRRLRESLESVVGHAIANLGIENHKRICDRLLEVDVVGGYYDRQDWFAELRGKGN